MVEIFGMVGMVGVDWMVGVVEVVEVVGVVGVDWMIGCLRWL